MPDDPLARVAQLPGVPEAVAGAREAVDGLLRHRMLRGSRSIAGELAAEAAIRAARSSAALDGEDIPLRRIRAGAPPGPPLLEGALRVNAALAGLAGTWHRAPRQVLARLHSLAAAGLAPADRLGRPRPPPPGPGPGEAAVRLDLLAEMLTGGVNGPALVLAAVVHGELLALRPFGVADPVVARAAQRLTLMTRGLDPKGLTVPEAGHLELRAGYAAALRGYEEGTPAGVGGWIQHCAAAVSLGARESVAVCEAHARGASAR